MLLRYRTAVPLMFALLALNYLAAQLVFAVRATASCGGAGRAVVNLLLFIAMLVGLWFSLWRRGGSPAKG